MFSYVLVFWGEDKPSDI